ncbi:PaaI family thioesterase [Rhodotorula paludigena]|uniref:PaaI family thioesterase n=1 Tax=Rhodotorula paludigena TaxID=86838 RepID=UPI0031757E7D
MPTPRKLVPVLLPTARPRRASASAWTPRHALSSSSRPTSAPPAAGVKKAPRRSLFLLSTALVSTGVLAGYGLALAAPRPPLVSLVFPVPTPHPPARDSPEAVENAEVIERGLQSLDVVRRLKQEVAPVPLLDDGPTSTTPAGAQTTSLIEVAVHQQSATSVAATPLAPRYTVSRPYASTPAGPHSLSGYALRGPGKFAVPPLVFTTHDKRENVIVLHVGGGMCGHEGVVHGGLLATVLDEAMGRTALLNLPTNIGVTATLSLKYKKPTFANQYLVIRTELVEQKGRKARVKARIENTEGETLVEAESLFVEPRFAQFLSNSSVREALK